jgi:hypothetical protein
MSDNGERTIDLVSTSYSQMLNEHLRLWATSGVPAPANELQSIQAWLSYLSEHGSEKTMSTMRTRMLLLMNAASNLHEQGPEAEAEVGIYDQRPDMRPKTFEQELRDLINRHSKENGSNTPDFLLAEYLVGCLSVFDTILTKRTRWTDGPNEVPNQSQSHELCTTSTQGSVR